MVRHEPVAKRPTITVLKSCALAMSKDPDTIKIPGSAVVSRRPIVSTTYLVPRSMQVSRVQPHYMTLPSYTRTRRLQRQWLQRNSS